MIIADDCALFREGLSLLLKELGFDVIGQAADADEVLEILDEDLPDVVILDIVMPPSAPDRCGGLIAAERLRRAYPDVGVLLLSGYDSKLYAHRLAACEGAGGKGYLIKERVTNPDTLRGALECVGAGGTRIDPEIVASLFNPQRRRTTLDHLTEREIEVLKLVAEGYSNRGIAERLTIADKTVDATYPTFAIS